LAAAAERALARGAVDVAIGAFERSAGLTPDPRIRALRLWQAANLSWKLGRRHESNRLFDDAQRLGLPPFEDAIATLLLESLAGTMSSGGAIVGAFTDLAELLLAEGEQEKALEALAMITVRAYWGNLDEETKRRASGVARTFDVPPDDPSRLCVLANVDPIRNGRVVLDQLAHVSLTPVGDGSALIILRQYAELV